MRKGLISRLLLFGLSATAAADESQDREVVISPVKVTAEKGPDADETGTRAPDARRALEEPAFVSTVDLSRSRGELRPVAEAVAESVGASVRSLGGLGSFSSISIRGAPAAHTEVLIDGVPLSRVAFSAVDLGDLDLGLYDRVDVFRGGVPAELGGAALGGAVNLLTDIGPKPGQPRTTCTVAGGSFGARRLGLVHRFTFNRRLRATTAVGYAGAHGDYLAFDDRGTPLNLDDDRTVRRKNNGFDRLDGVARLAGRAQGLSVEGGQRLSWRSHGVPGPTGVSAQHTHLGTWRSVTDLKVRRSRWLGVDALDAGASGWLMLERQSWSDPAGEIGLGIQDRAYTTVAGGLALRGTVAVGQRQLVALVAEPRADWFADVDRMSSTKILEGSRAGVALSLSDDIVIGRAEALVLQPALRLDAYESRRTGDLDGTFQDDSAPRTRRDVELSPRISARWALSSAVSLKGNLGRAFRLPTLVELFGDRGVVVGNPALAPETGISADLGWVVAPQGRMGPLDRIHLELATFALAARQLIAFVPTSGRVAVARNLGDADLAGHEAALSLRLLRRVNLTANYTFLHTQRQSRRVFERGKRLPGRPRHELYGRLEVTRRLGGRVQGSGRVDATFVDGNYLDTGNLNQVPRRKFIGLGLRVSVHNGPICAIDIKNLLDETVEEVPLSPAPRPGLHATPRAVSDVLGYPLPGRAVYATVEWSF